MPPKNSTSIKTPAKMRKKSLRALAETSGWPKSDCAIIPEKRNTRPRFDSFLQFAFELRLAYSRLVPATAADSRLRAKDCESQVVNDFDSPLRRLYSSPRALHNAIHDVLHYANMAHRAFR